MLIILLISTSAFTTGNAQTPESADYWPTDGWRTSPPEQQGMDSQILARAFDFIKEHNTNIHSMHIIRNGYMVLNAYFYPYPESSVHDLASVTKSITSLLIGIAIDEGFIPSVDTPVIKLFPQHKIANMSPNKKNLTVRNLLTMTSGYDCSYEGGERQLVEMRKSNDWIAYMLDLPVMVEPGMRFSYCSGNFHLLAGILLKTTGLSPKAFAQQHVFMPLGIEEVIWPADPDGVNFGWGDLHIKPIDMAKIGYLFLNEGKWDNRQIVSLDWIDQATRPSVRLSEDEDYGYGWWIRPAPHPGIYEALGRAGQRIIVWPAKNMVIVFTGDGFEPGDIGPFIVSSVKSDTPLPPNDPAYEHLLQKVAEAKIPPLPQPLQTLPDMVRRIDGKEYVCEDNDRGFKRLSLFFPNKNEALMKIVLQSTTLEIPLGLDGVYRMSPTGELGLPRASRGIWQTENKLVLSLYQVSRMDLDEMALTFESNKVLIEIDDITIKGAYTLLY